MSPGSSVEMDKPQFKHDAECCVFLGRWHCIIDHWQGDYDLYFCDQGDLPVTVLARFGDEGSEYTSSLSIALSGNCPPLRQAVQMTMNLLSGKNDLVQQLVLEKEKDHE